MNLGLSKLIRPRPQVSAPPPPPAPKTWVDQSGIEWSYKEDHLSRAAAGKYIVARYGGCDAQCFMPEGTEDLFKQDYADAAKEGLLKRLTPLENYLLTGRCFQ